MTTLPAEVKYERGQPRGPLLSNKLGYLVEIQFYKQRTFIASRDNRKAPNTLTQFPAFYNNNN